MQHNGQTTAEIQEEVAVTNLQTVSTAEKRHSNTDRFHFPRADLQTITTLGKVSLLHTPFLKWCTSDLAVLFCEWPWEPQSQRESCFLFWGSKACSHVALSCVSFMCPLENPSLMWTHQWPIDKRNWVGQFTVDAIAQVWEKHATTVMKKEFWST